MDNITKKTIGKRINNALAFRNVKQKELAKVLEISDNTVSFFCSGSRVPNHEQIIQIAKYLNVSADYLLGLTDSMTNNKDIQFICDYTGLNSSVINILHDEQTKEMTTHCNSVINTIFQSTNCFALFKNLYYYLHSNMLDVRNYDDNFHFDFNIEDYTTISALLFTIKESNESEYVTNSLFQQIEPDFWESFFMMNIQHDLNEIKNDISE